MPKTFKAIGQSINRLWTIGSWYAKGLIAGTMIVKGEEVVLRIHVNTILSMVDEFVFDVTSPEGDKRRKYYYLENPRRIKDSDDKDQVEREEFLSLLKGEK